MISILIPVYNFDIRALVVELDQQAQKLAVKFEIIVADDRSCEAYRATNSEIKTISSVNYIELEQNIGRSKIRNKLADIARFENLLFLDCDSFIDNPDYLKQYLDYCNRNDIVVYGGRTYKNVPPSHDYFFHWYYGRNREEITSVVRAENPNCCFMTNNFLICKDLFNQIRFNEFIRRYGHEDTLFGYELKRKKVEVVHIDNPLVHEGLEKNDEFIRKTQAGLNNLKIIVNQNGYLKDLVNDITVLKYYNICKQLHARSFISLIFKGVKPFIIKNLCGKRPRLFLFDFFKLGYLTSVMLKK
jgi:glycosyltransferase involved in cell wall biosynthesis